MSGTKRKIYLTMPTLEVLRAYLATVSGPQTAASLAHHFRQGAVQMRVYLGRLVDSGKISRTRGSSQMVYLYGLPPDASGLACIYDNRVTLPATFTTLRHDECAVSIPPSAQRQPGTWFRNSPLASVFVC